MSDYGEIYRYMGHKGAPNAQLTALVCTSLEKLAAVCAPLHVTMQLPCTVADTRLTIGTLDIESKSLAAHLHDCTQTYIFAATLGAAVDRLIGQRTKVNSAEGLCIQACAAVQIEGYCNCIEQDLAGKSAQCGLYLSPRFSPGYGDFNIAHQTGILRVLQAQQRIGLTETKTHMLTPLKSVTAVIGVSPNLIPNLVSYKCAGCVKTDCLFRKRGKVQ